MPDRGRIAECVMPARTGMHRGVLVLALLVSVALSSARANQSGWPAEEPTTETRNSDQPLAFLEAPASEPEYRFEATIRISADSLASGIVTTDTCHRELDPIQRVDIVFDPQRRVSVEVIDHQGIGKVATDGMNVALHGVTRHAHICLRLVSRSLERDGARAVLRGGPLQRRYLDTFHPMQVDARVVFDPAWLRFEQMSPPPGPGWRAELTQPDTLRYGGRFAGRLQTAVTFLVLTPTSGGPP